MNTGRTDVSQGRLDDSLANAKEHTCHKENGPSHCSTSARILVIAPQPFYEDRGTPIALRHVLEALSQCGAEVDLLTYPIGETVELPGLRTFRIGNLFRIRRVPIGFSLRKLLLDLLLVSAIWKWLKQNKYSCVHAVEEGAFPAVLLGRWHNVPVIYDMHSSLPEQMKQYPMFRSALVQRALRFCERWLIRNADSIVCSAGLKDYVRTVDASARVQEWRFPARRINASAKEVKRLRKNLGIAPGTRVIVYSGNFKPYQGLSKLIDAIPHVLSDVPSTVFLLVGGHGPANFCFSKTAAELQEQGALRLVTRQSRTAVSQFLVMADVVVSPREHGLNLPLKIFDYMAAGRPIVAIDSPTHRAVLNDELAVLVRPSAHELGAAIARLLQEPKEAARLGAAAQAHAEKNFGWKPFVGLVSQLYDHTQARS